MRVIHCADLHLDSKMTGNLDRAKAKERKAELLNTFVRMVEYASLNGVEAILIAGDMFDTGTISALTRNTVRDTIIHNSDIDFYYLKGNHDRDSFLSSLDEVPANLKLFTDEWRSYPLDDDGNVILTAIELSPSNNSACYNALVLDTAAVNIVMMHGQDSDTGVTRSTRDKAGLIALKELRNKGIDYLALGHIHAYREDKLDLRGVYCYPGCLEGRGFDETGEHGFVLLDIDPDSHHIDRHFIPFASRLLYQIDVDITGLHTTAEIVDRISSMLSDRDMSGRSMVKLVLTGSVDIEAEKDIDFILKSFEDRYYYLKISDESGYSVDYTDYSLDASLKGEYVRLIQVADDISEADKPEVIRMGLMAIAGEEI